MKYLILDIPPAGSWKRDCELVEFNFQPLGLQIAKESDYTKWNITFDGIIAFKITSEEFTIHLQNVPTSGSFYIVENSAWLHDFSKIGVDVLKKCKHHVLFLYDELIEVISQKMNYEKIE